MNNHKKNKIHVIFIKKKFKNPNLYLKIRLDKIVFI